ncbi:hypothetical protein Q5P01_018702 [Channa striata]|uniref:MHC class I-like antigen recognition-like domain-containing protein n=1 Tax=Channa striata TaxID=64152 RepID=A0AA88M5P8_CHASR|nr:hypothetical protein Q5P01_018702 [Channa striata]
MKYVLTGSSGVPNFPEFVGIAKVNEVQVGYCDSIMKKAEPKHEWMKKIEEHNPQHVEWNINACLNSQYYFKDFAEELKQRFNKSGGKLSGVKDDIITKLDKAVIRSNEEFPVGLVVGVVAGLILLAVCIAGFFIWRAKKNTGSDTSSENNSEEQAKMMKPTA